MQRKDVLWGLNAIGGVVVGLGLTSCLTTEYEGVPPGPLEGIADLHLHMYAEDAFGGGWLHGTVDGDGPTALPPCDGGSLAITPTSAGTSLRSSTSARPRWISTRSPLMRPCSAPCST